MKGLVFDLQLFVNITNYKSNTLVGGTADNDSIYISGANVTINAGAGNDTVSDYSDDYESYGNGNIILTSGNLTASLDVSHVADTIQTASALKSSVASGNNMIFTTADNHTVKVLNATDKEFSVVNGKILIDKAVDTVNVTGNNYWDSARNRVIVGSSGDDHIGNSDSNVTINAGKGNDYIDIGSWWSRGIDNVITSGSGKDTISFAGIKNVTITDFSTDDVLRFYYTPKYAAFNKTTHILDFGNLKINLPNVSNIDDYRDMLIKNWGEKITLGELLDQKKFYWKISGTTATYYDGNGKVMATLTGLKSGLKVVNGEISGIEINSNNEIILSKSVLGTGTVELDSHFYSLDLSDDVDKANIDDLGWSVSGGTATARIKATIPGYYVGAGGKKIKYITKFTNNFINKYAKIHISTC